jgi:hypothetical protein
MALIVGNQKKSKPLANVNKELLKLKGDLTDEEARVSLAKFLRYNLGFTTELSMGLTLEAYQELTLNSFFNRNYCMLVWGRGGAKSFCAAIYCILKCMLEPGTKILIASINFRTSRRVFNEIEKFLMSPDAALARQCFGLKSKRNDQYEWQINGGSITAIPLTGEKIRGIRANVLILDEFLLLPPDIIDNVLIPFLSSPRDVGERIRIRKLEDELIKKGLLHPENRHIFENTSQMLCLSSASYTFEHLFRVYQQWSHLVEHPEEQESKEGELPGTYFISQLSYEALPQHMVDQGAIQVAKSGGSSHHSFLREYCARFIDGGDSYFSPKKMHDCTIPDGEYPTTKVIGDSDKKYIIAIDPNFSSSKVADYFAMSVIEIDEEKKQGVLVHGYQAAGSSLQDHIKYFYYLYKNFNIALIVIDHAGADTFIDAVNNSQYFKDMNRKIGFVDFDSDKENEDYTKMLKDCARQYNKDFGNICIKQYFTSFFLGRANSYLQTCIDHKKIWFASRASNHPDILENIFTMNLPMEYIYPRGIGDKADNEYETKKLTVREFIEQQDFIVQDTKDQCANVEVTTTSRGTQSFDLPSHLRKSTSINRARKDNYTTLMLGNWGVKAYFDIMAPENFTKKNTEFVAELI